ncbi:hypothetical protein DJ533_00080 (plasmid) [Acinetobacter defluvii]|uniref:Uncharacterized protein n=1 Tax=Acinetobacter defluvii TaxID=1871111 RepID=A0A2S2F840_9GAMM|nr:hypothetical protein [Acinetobacter defluvii]AWL27117.1 hypothetical protein DJ533_00080 [Acinetobacter defluvii]
MPTLHTKDLSLEFFNEQVMTFLLSEDLSDQELQSFLENMVLIFIGCLGNFHDFDKSEFFIEQMKNSIDLSRSFYEETETKQ